MPKGEAEHAIAKSLNMTVDALRKKLQRARTKKAKIVLKKGSYR
ncbi:MAG: hypothetical protein WCD69_25430 [Xanthobacteraceae bacterium]